MTDNLRDTYNYIKLGESTEWRVRDNLQNYTAAIIAIINFKYLSYWSTNKHKTLKFKNKKINVGDIKL